MNIKAKYILAFAAACVLAIPGNARKQGYRFKTPKEKSVTASKKSDMTASVEILDRLPDIDYVARRFPDMRICSADSLNIILSGYDKKRNSSKESFFIINESDENFEGVVVQIRYYTPDDRMLHSRNAIITTVIPSGETRKTDLPSFDTQHSFYYYLSDSDPSRGNPYKVSIRPLVIILKKDVGGQ